MAKTKRYKGYSLFLENKDGNKDDKYFVTIFHEAAQVDCTEYKNDEESAFEAAINTVDLWERQTKK